MAGHVNAQAAQLLNQSPDFGTAGRNFLGDLGAADDDSGMFHQQANDVTEAEISGLGLMRRRHPAPRKRLTNCAGLGDAEIMRELRRNNNRASGWDDSHAHIRGLRRVG